MLKRPMLCARLGSAEQLRYPVGVTPKLDGVRCLLIGGQALTRAFKPVQNAYISRLLTEHLPDGLDGELMAGGFAATQSAVMSRAGEPPFEYCVFDMWNAPGGYWDRMHALCEAVHALSPLPFKLRVLVPQVAASPAELEAQIAAYIAAGYEGAVTRAPHGPYKNGRSTPSEQYMVKWKKLLDSEAVVVGFVEGRENRNPIVPNAFGLAKRPGGKALKVPKGTLGALSVRDGDMAFEIGSGFDDALRRHVWDNQHLYLGARVTYKYQEIGSQGKPRFPVFVGFRYDG